MLLRAIARNMFLWTVVLGHLIPGIVKNITSEIRSAAREIESPVRVIKLMVERKLMSTKSKQLV